jgi:hypothetical protein
MTGNAYFQRMMAFDYKSQDAADLMYKIWRGTPFMTRCFTGQIGEEKDGEIREWCIEHFGPEAWPIHGRPGNWNRGSVTLFGWTDFGFATSEMLAEFEAAHQCDSAAP